MFYIKDRRGRSRRVNINAYKGAKTSTQTQIISIIGTISRATNGYDTYYYKVYLLLFLYTDMCREKVRALSMGFNRVDECKEYSTIRSLWSKIMLRSWLVSDDTISGGRVAELEPGKG